MFDALGRRFFYTVTNSFLGNPNDFLGYWNTDELSPQGQPRYPDGDYRVLIYAKDFNGNTFTDDVVVTVNNGLHDDHYCMPDIMALDPQGMELTSPL